MVEEAGVAIRPYRPDDAEAVYEAAIESVREVHPFMPWCRPDMTVEEQRVWIEAQVLAFEARKAYEFVITSEDGKFLGGCGLNQIDDVNHRANLGYWVRSSATGHGIATAAIRQLVEWAFRNTDLVRLEVVASTQNAASLRAAERAGAVREGVLRKRLLLHGTRHDAVMFSFVRGDNRPCSHRDASQRQLPALVAHADWSCDPRKRWILVARQQEGSYELSVPEPVGDVGSLLHRLTARADGGSVLLGVDFPIGLPVAYAKAACVKRFLDVLPLFGTGPWSRFYDIAGTPAEIGVRRPLYPLGSGSGPRQLHLTSALGVSSMRDLLRECERGHKGRGPACCLFWTLGGQQVGRAAIVGWRDLLAPALRDDPERIGLWSFHGSLDRLLAKRRCVVAETYPAEACRHLGLPPPGRGWSKRKQRDRQRQADRLLAWSACRRVALSKTLATAIPDGFGTTKSGEDRFDSVVGLMSMLEVLLGHRTDGAPSRDAVQKVEGWIFGQLPACPSGGE